MGLALVMAWPSIPTWLGLGCHPGARWQWRPLRLVRLQWQCYTRTPTWPQVVAQTSDIVMVLNSIMSHRHQRRPYSRATDLAPSCGPAQMSPWHLWSCKPLSSVYPPLVTWNSYPHMASGDGPDPFVWLLVVSGITDINPGPGCSGIMDPDVVPHCSPGSDIDMALGGSLGHPA